jgi:hypothetical protein
MFRRINPNDWGFSSSEHAIEWLGRRSMEFERGDAPATTPTGETGVQDYREPQGGHGTGRVADAADVHSRDEDNFAQASPLDDDPTAEDPYESLPPSAVVEQMQRGPGPTYERGQGTADPSTGGSSDPHDSMTHANSGDETEMPDQVDNQNRSQEAVDGFADTQGETNVGSPDPGANKKANPMDPEEYAKAQREARTEEDESGS